MPDSCDSSTTSEEGASAPGLVPHVPSSDSGSAHAPEWSTRKHNLDLDGKAKGTIAHVQNAMMSEACAQNQFVMRPHVLDNRQGALLSQPPSIAKNEGWVSFNKEVLQNILENTIKLQMTQTDSADDDTKANLINLTRDEADNSESTPESVHDTDSSDCVVNVDGSTSVDSDSDSESINVTRCDDDCSTHDEEHLANHERRRDYTCMSDVCHDPRRDSFRDESSPGPRLNDFEPMPGVQCLRNMPGKRQYGADAPDDLSGSGVEQARQAVAGYVRTCGSHPVKDALVNSRELDVYQCWQRSTITDYRLGRSQVTGDSRGDRLQARATQPLIVGSTGEFLQHHNTATLAALHQSALIAQPANMIVEQSNTNTDELSTKLDYHSKTKHRCSHKDGRTCVPCKKNIFVEDKEASNMMKRGETCINSDKCFSDERLDNNSKKKGRQCKVKVSGRQHWVRISKAAIEDILDELVVSSISDDSGTESRSNTPTSDISETSHDAVCHQQSDDDVLHADTDRQTPNSVHDDSQTSKRQRSPSPSTYQSSVTHKEGSCSPTTVQCPSAPINSKPSEVNNKQVISSCSNHALDKPVSKSECLAMSNNSKETDSVPGRLGSEVNVDALSKVVSMGWAVLNKPMISDVVDRALGCNTLDTDDSRSDNDIAEKDVYDSCESSCGDRSRNCSGESANEFKQPSTQESEPLIDDQKDISEVGLMSSGPWSNPATALLLGALCIGEHKKVCQLAEARANKRPSLTGSTGPSSKYPRNDVECVGVDLRTSKRDDNPVANMPEDERQNQLRNVYMSHNWKHPVSSLPQGKKTSLVSRTTRTSRTRSRGSRASIDVTDEESAGHEVIDVDKHDMSSYSPRPAHIPVSGHNNTRVPTGFRPVSIIPGQASMCAAINLASNKVPLDLHTSNDRNNSRYSSEQNVVIIDGGQEYSSEPTDLSAHPEKMSMVMAKTVKVEKQTQNKSGRKNNKNSAKCKKEPRYGWVVVSKDEVHTIMDSLTSQLFMDDLIESSENDAKDGSTQDIRTNNKHGCNLSQADVLRNKGNDMKQTPRGQTTSGVSKGVSPNNGGVSKDDGDSILDKSVIDSGEELSYTRPPHSDELHSQDDEFRRTAIDALKAVYYHEDGMETSIKSFSTDQQQSQSQDITAVPSPNKPSSPSTSPVKSQTKASSANDDVRMTCEVSVPDAEKPVPEQADDTSSPDTACTITTDSKLDSAMISESQQEQASKGFKWKSSILARVLDDQDTDVYSRTVQPETKQTKTRKRLSNTFGNRRTKNTNKRR